MYVVGLDDVGGYVCMYVCMYVVELDDVCMDVCRQEGMGKKRRIYDDVIHSWEIIVLVYTCHVRRA